MQFVHKFFLYAMNINVVVQLLSRVNVLTRREIFLAGAFITIMLIGELPRETLDSLLLHWTLQ